MKVVSVWSEEEATLLLIAGTREEREEGLRQVHQNMMTSTCAKVRKFFPGLKPDDLRDVWSETLTALWKTVEAGNFDPEPSLGGWLFSVAHRRAVDCLRRLTTDQKALEEVGVALRGTRVGQVWNPLSPPERNEITNVILDMIRELPFKQRAVLQAYIDDFPETKNTETLRRLVSDRIGTEETVVAIKSALREGRRVVAEALRKKGFSPGGDV